MSKSFKERNGITMDIPEYLTIRKIKEVAACLWWKNTSRKGLAEKFNLTEAQVDELRATPEYQKQVESLMLGQRSAEDFEKCVKKWHKDHGNNAVNAFGKRMALEPKVVPAMVKNVRKAHADIAAGKIEAPEYIPDPNKNMNLNPEKTIGIGRNSVYCYYDQQERESAESKGEKIWACNIGETIRELHTRIHEQADTVLPAEKLKVGLHIKTDKHKEIERIIHDVLKVRGKHIPESPRTDWFLTSPSEVEEIYNSIGENSRESASSTLS